MSIHITSQLAPGVSASMSFLERGLNGRSAGEIQSSVVFPVGNGATPGDSLVLRYIAQSFENARTKTTPAIPAENIKVIQHVTSYLGTPPPMYINPKSSANFTSDELRANGLLESSEIRARTWVGRPTYAQLSGMWARLDSTAQPAPGTCNAAGLLSFYVAWKVVGIFQCAWGSRVRADLPFPTATDAPTVKFPTASFPVVGATAPESWEVLKEVKDVPATTFHAPSSMIIPIVAVCSTPSRFWQSTGSVNENGHPFPYFDGMIKPDNTYVFSTIARNFSGVLGNSTDAVGSLLQVLRLGFKALAQTPQGQELSHLFFGINLTMQTGGRLRIISERSKYLGFYVETNRSLVVGNRVVGPVGSEELSGCIADMDRHAATIRKMKEVLDGVTLLDGTYHSVSVDDLMASSRNMAKEIYKRTWDDPAEKMTVETLLDKLSYNDIFLEVNVANIRSLMSRIVANDWNWDDAPYYLRSGMAFSDNTISRLLAAFGPRAPYVNVIAGNVKKFSVPRSAANDANLTSDTDPLRYIPIRASSIQAASASWSHMRSTKLLQFKAARSDKKEWVDAKDVAFRVAQDPLPGFYEEIRTFMWAGQSDEERRGVKRTAESGDSGPKSKRAKEMSTVADVASLL